MNKGKRTPRSTWKNTLKKSGKLSCVLILASTMGAQSLIGMSGTSIANLPINWAASQVYASEVGPKIVKRDESYITSGAKLLEYRWTSADGVRSSDVRVIEIDLHNPYVEVDVMTGRNGKVATKNTVRRMAVESGAVAGVNGDFYVISNPEAAPMGPQVTSGELVVSPSKLQGMYAFGITADNVPVIERFDFTGVIANDQGAYYPLAGMNKTYYFTEPDKTHSHVDAIYIYTSDWGQVSRAADGMTTPTEMLVKDGIVQEISVGQALDMTPPEDGYIVRAHRKASEFIVQNFQIGDKVQLDYELKPINPSQSFDANALKMLIGGHTLLVNEGKAANYTRSVTSIGGSRARTGVGFSKDGRFAYLITVDGGGDNSGIYLGEFRELMVELGVWKGLNLDGGGSTQLVSRPLGDTQVKLVNRPEFVSERSVVNGIGIYTNAPVGPVKDMILQGRDTLLIGETTPYALKAYDIYYNPKNMADAEVEWSATSGSFTGNAFTPTRPGRVTLTAKSDGVERSLEVDVLGYNQVESLKFNVEKQTLPIGKFVELPLKLKTVTGDTFDVPVSSVDWEFYGFVGDVTEQGIRVRQVTAEDGLAQIVARYDGFGTIVALNTGIEKLYTDFSSNRPKISFTGYPSSVEGSTQIVYGLPGMVSGQRALQINYDFSEGEVGVTKAAYALFNEGEGIELEGEPLQMNLRIKGDNSLNWLRAEVVDAKGKKHLVDIERDMNDTNMSTVVADFTAYNMSYPVKLTRIYVASPSERQEEREVRGSVLIDSISFVYPREQTEERGSDIQLKVGSQKMMVNGVETTLDQAPIVVGDRTLVPIRFISEALGATLKWKQDEKRVTLIDRDQLIDLWVDQLDLLHNGERKQTDVAPIVKNGRTLVPLRMISETFGWNVEWNQKEQTIRLKG